MAEGIAWKCECGNMEYGQYPPQECRECEAINSFLKVPDDLIEELEEKRAITKLRQRKKK